MSARKNESALRDADINYRTRHQKEHKIRSPEKYGIARLVLIHRNERCGTAEARFLPKTVRGSFVMLRR